ncbi:unnamed protein product, partial [Closterium sp. NIES-65]
GRLTLVCPTTLTVNLLEKSSCTEKSILAVGPLVVTRAPPSLRGVPPSPLLPSVASAATADLVGFESVGAASAPSGRRRSGKGKGGWSGGGGGGGGGSGGGGSGGGGGGSGSGVGVEVSAAAVEAGWAAAVVVGVEAEAAVAAATVGVAVAAEVVAARRRRRRRRSWLFAEEWLRWRSAPTAAAAACQETLSPQQLREWYAARQRGGGTGPCTYVLRTGDRAGVAIFDLDFDAILAAMYAVTISEEGDCYRCFPPDPGIGTAALGAVEAAAPGAGEAVALGARASRSFFRDRTTLTPLSRPVAVSLADPSGGPVLARYSTVLPCPAVPSGALSVSTSPRSLRTWWRVLTYRMQGSTSSPARRRDTHCPDADNGSTLDHVHTWAGVEPVHTHCSVSSSCVWSVAASGQVFAAASRMGHPSLPRLRGMAFSPSCLWPSPVPPSPSSGAWPPCVPCVEGRLRATPHSSPFPPTEAPMQTLHMDVWAQPASVDRVGDASAFRVWGSRAFVRDLSADKLSPRAAPCVFLGFPPDALGGSFTTHLSSCSVPQDVTFDESVPSTTGSSPTALRVSQVDAVEPVEVTGDSGAAAGAEPRVLRLGVLRLGVLSLGVLRLGVLSLGVLSLGPGGSASGSAALAASVPGGSLTVLRAASRSHPLELRCGLPGAGGELLELGVLRVLEVPFCRGSWYHGSRRCRTEGTRAAGPGGASGAGAAAGAGAETTTVGPTAGTSAAAGGAGVGAATGAGAASGGVGPVPAVSGGAARPRPYFVPLLQQVLGLPPSTGPSPPVECPQPVPSQSQLQPASLLPSPSPYAGPTGGLAERREPASRPASPVRAARSSGRGSSSLPTLADPESDSRRAASPTVTRLLASLVTDPSFESAAASALVAELVDFAAACRLDYAASLVAESAESAESASAASASACLRDGRSPTHLSGSQPWDAEMASWKSTGTYVDAVTPPGANIVSGMWIFRVKRPPGSPPVFKARYGLVASRDYELHSLTSFSTAFLQGRLHEEIWLRRPPGFTGSFPPGTQWSLQPPRPVYGLRQAPREWHDTLRTTLAALGLLLLLLTRRCFCAPTPRPAFYILVYVDDLVFATADTAALAH